jgi:hypothetical protein
VALRPAYIVLGRGGRYTGRRVGSHLDLGMVFRVQGRFATRSYNEQP